MGQPHSSAGESSGAPGGLSCSAPFEFNAQGVSHGGDVGIQPGHEPDLLDGLVQQHLVAGMVNEWLARTDFDMMAPAPALPTRDVTRGHV